MKRLKHVIRTILFGCAVAILVYAASQTVVYWPFLRIQNTIDDSHFIRRFMLNGTDGNDTGNIVIVDIDDRTIKSLGVFKRWNRMNFVKVIQKLNQEGVRLIFLVHPINAYLDSCRA